MCVYVNGVNAKFVQYPITKLSFVNEICAIFTLLCATSCSPFVKENPGVQSPCVSPAFRLVHQVCLTYNILKRATDKILEVGYLYFISC